MEQEAVGGSKHQTESSAERQLPVGDVYSPKLPCALVTSVADRLLAQLDAGSYLFLHFPYSYQVHSQLCRHPARAGNHMESVHLVNIMRWLPLRMMCAAKKKKADSRVQRALLALPSCVFLENHRGEVSMTSFLLCHLCVGILMLRTAFNDNAKIDTTAGKQPSILPRK